MKNNYSQDTVLIAGWLFADLLLGLSMIFLIMNFNGGGQSALATQTPTATPSPVPTTTPTRTPTPTEKIPTPTQSKPSPVPTGTLAAPGLGDAQCYNVNLRSEDVSFQERSVINQLNYQLPNQEDIRSGLVLVWAHGKNLGGRAQFFLARRTQGTARYGYLRASLIFVQAPYYHTRGRFPDHDLFVRKTIR